MKTWKLMTIAIILSLAIIAIIVMNSRPQSNDTYTVSDKLDVTWKWMPSSGSPAYYIVEKFTFGMWFTDAIVPHVVNDDGYVYGTIVSKYPELYKIKVTAVDAAGNRGPTSPESNWVLVMPAPRGEAPTIQP